MDLKVYRQKLIDQDLAVFYDSYHVKKTFGIIGDISDFIAKNTSSYKVEKKRKIIKKSLSATNSTEWLTQKKYREIYIVTSRLEYIQKWILENILGKIPVSHSAHGFIKGKSLLTNAKVHLRKENSWLMRLDISNFFESITIVSVKKVFSNMGYSKSASLALASLCTHKGMLRQGFCTSPTLSNIYLKNFDNEITKKIKLYSDFDVRYSRYADDLFFSGIDSCDTTKVVNYLKQISGFYLKHNRLSLNYSKTSIQKAERKRITGLYIDSEGVTVSKTYKKKLERELYFCEKYGVMAHLNHTGNLDKMDFYKYIMGRCAFVKMVEPDIGSSLISRVKILMKDY